MIEDELAPCPFCTSPGKIIHRDAWNEWYVTCSSSDCWANGCTALWTTEAEAVKVWNTRSSAPPAEEEVERDDVHQIVTDALRKFGYWQFDLTLGGDGGFEASWRTREGYQTLERGDHHKTNP